jgi:hypothetical protein
MDTRWLVLEQAAVEIEQRGWAQARAITDDGRVCVRESIHLARKTLGLEPHTFDGAVAALCDYIGRQTLPRWNDTPGRTRNEILQALRDCAAKLQPDEMRCGD